MPAERIGVDPAVLPEQDLVRELSHLHETRHDTFLFGSDDALAVHTRRTAELEAEYLRRHPQRHVSPDRVRPEQVHDAADRQP